MAFTRPPPALAGGDVEGRIARREARRDLRRVALLDRDAPAGRRRHVERRRRSDDVERDVVVASRDRECIRPDLVGGIPVGRDPVGTGEDAVHVAGRHQRRSCGVDDHGEGDAERSELPRGQPGALQERARLVHPHVLDEAALPRSPNGAERRPEATCCQAARVAMSQDPRARLDEVGRVRGHPPAALDLGFVNRASMVRARIVPHLVECPAQVDRRRACRRELVVGDVEVLVALGRQRVAVRGRDSDRRRPADSQGADCVGDGRRGAEPELDLLVWEAPLVEYDDGVALEPHDPLRRERRADVYVPSSHEARYFACSSVS